jgi:CheY-like chemotaxis protein
MPHRALVVDDDAAVRRALVRALDGYQVDLAVDGVEGEQCLQTGRYDVVITDLRMPRADGLGVSTPKGLSSLNRVEAGFRLPVSARRRVAPQRRNPRDLHRPT